MHFSTTCILFTLAVFLGSPQMEAHGRTFHPEDPSIYLWSQSIKKTLEPTETESSSKSANTRTIQNKLETGPANQWICISSNDLADAEQKLWKKVQAEQKKKADFLQVPSFESFLELQRLKTDDLDESEDFNLKTKKTKLGKVNSGSSSDVKLERMQKKKKWQQQQSKNKWQNNEAELDDNNDDDDLENSPETAAESEEYSPSSEMF